MAVHHYVFAGGIEIEIVCKGEQRERRISYGCCAVMAIQKTWKLMKYVMLCTA
jgi:hypothetical protein